MGSTGSRVRRGTVTTTVPQDQVTVMDNQAMSAAEQQRKVRELQNAMGQTGYEAGDPNVTPRRKLYVNTSKAYDINYYLNTGKVGSPDSNWTNLGYTGRMIKNDIARIDRGMRPMSESVLTYRYITPGALSRMLGTGSSWSTSDVNNLISTVKNNPSAQQSLTTALKNLSYTNKAYSSMSYVKEHSTFDAYPVRLNVTVRKGTNAIVTNNHREHEILVARNSQYKFTGCRVQSEYSTARGRNQDYLVIDVEV